MARLGAKHCAICRRELDTGEALALNCGGDCWGCVSVMEAEMAGVSVEKYRERPDYYFWLAAKNSRPSK